VIGELDGPVGYAIANLIGDQVKGHTRVWAILNSDVQVRPATLMVSKVHGPQRPLYEHPHGHRAGGRGQCRAGRRPRGTPPQEQGQRHRHHRGGVARSFGRRREDEDRPRGALKTHREATFNAIRKAMANEPSIDWLLKNQKKVGHYFHELALKGEL